MDIIFVKGLVVPTVIGIYNWERSCFQELIFDLEIAYRSRINICNNVRMSNYYIDYQKVSTFVSTLISKSCFFLIESVAEIVAMELMLQFNVPWIRVKVTKVGALSKSTNVGVVIERGIRHEIKDK